MLEIRLTRAGRSPRLTRSSNWIAIPGSVTRAEMIVERISLSVAYCMTRPFHRDDYRLN